MTRNLSRHFIHVVWATKYRRRSIRPEWRRSILRALGSACRQLGCLIVAANMVSDHVHVLITLPVTVSVSTVVQAMKGHSAYIVNRDFDSEGAFRWQRGFSVFSVSQGYVPRVVRYIRNQESHHAAKERAWSQHTPSADHAAAHDTDWAVISDCSSTMLESSPYDDAIPLPEEEIPPRPS